MKDTIAIVALALGSAHASTIHSTLVRTKEARRNAFSLTEAACGRHAANAPLVDHAIVHLVKGTISPQAFKDEILVRTRAFELTRTLAYQAPSASGCAMPEVLQPK